MTTTTVAHPGYRLRDFVAGLVVLMIGSAMIYTVYTEGDGASVNLTYRAFALGALLLMTAYGIGTGIDRLGRRFPVLVRPRRSPLPAAIVITVLVTGLGYAAFEARELFMSWVW